MPVRLRQVSGLSIGFIYFALTNASANMEKSTSDWILSAIKQRECVLFIGPDLAFSGSTKSRGSQLRDHLKHSKIDEKTWLWNDAEELFDFEGTGGLVKNEIRNFYRELQPESVYEKIAAIPFPLVVTTSPDDLLHKAFGHLQKPLPPTNYYHKKTLNEPVEPPEGEQRTLVYNLLGSATNPGSMVLTYDDVFDYFTSISEFRLPETIENLLKKAELYIFLGFSFNRWHLKLLFKVLNLFGKPGMANELPEGETRNFYARRFPKDFIYLNQSSTELIEALHAAYHSQLQVPENTPKTTAKRPDLYETMSFHIKEGDLDTFFREMAATGISSAERVYLDLQETTYKRIKRERGEGGITHEVFNASLNQLTKALLDFLSQISGK